MESLVPFDSDGLGVKIQFQGVLNDPLRSVYNLLPSRND